MWGASRRGVGREFGIEFEVVAFGGEGDGERRVDVGGMDEGKVEPRDERGRCLKGRGGRAEGNEERIRK